MGHNWRKVTNFFRNTHINNAKFGIQNSKLFVLLSFEAHHWRVGGSPKGRPANDDTPLRRAFLILANILTLGGLVRHRGERSMRESWPCLQIIIIRPCSYSNKNRNKYLFRFLCGTPRRSGICVVLQSITDPRHWTYYNHCHNTL